MLMPAPTMADTMAVITGKGLLMPTLRLPLDAMEVVDMVVEVVVDTGARGLLMLKPAPTKGMVYMAMDGASNSAVSNLLKQF